MRFHLCRLWCWLFGHGRIDSIRSMYRDPESVEAREMVALFWQQFGSPFVCLRCGKPMGDDA